MPTEHARELLKQLQEQGIENPSGMLMDFAKSMQDLLSLIDCLQLQLNIERGTGAPEGWQKGSLGGNRWYKPVKTRKMTGELRAWLWVDNMPHLEDGEHYHWMGGLTDLTKHPKAYHPQEISEWTISAKNPYEAMKKAEEKFNG